SGCPVGTVRSRVARARTSLIKHGPGTEQSAYGVNFSTAKDCNPQVTGMTGYDRRAGPAVGGTPT
ncbi:hypothetical protein ACWCQV_40645, partial [Streptomyces eurythermus]